MRPISGFSNAVGASWSSGVPSGEEECLLAGTVFELPTFVCVLFIGVILSNGLALAGLYRVFDRAVSVLGPYGQANSD
jgi:sodium--glutamate symport carrier gltS